MNNSNQNYDLVSEMADALNTAWTGQVIPGINPTSAIKSIKRGVQLVGAGNDKFVVRFNDGSKSKDLTQDQMRMFVQGQPTE